MERDSKIKVETPSTTKKRKTQDNRKTPKSKTKLFSTQKNTIFKYFLKNEEPQRDFSEENNEPTNSSVKESLPSLHKSSTGPSNENETSNSSIFEISAPSFYLKIKENTSALSARASHIAEQAISMSTNNNLSPSGRHLNIETTSDESFQYILKSKIKSATEKKQLKLAPAEGPGRRVKTLPRPTFVAASQSKVEMKIGSNIGNNTIENSKGEFNTRNVKDNKVKDTLNDNSVLLISDDSDDEKVSHQIFIKTRHNLIGKDNCDYNQTNDEKTIESSSQQTYSLIGSGNTVMFDDNSLSESENSGKITKDSSVLKKVMIKQDSILTEDDIDSSMYELQSRRHHGIDITLDGEQTQQSENNNLASSDESSVTFNDLKKTKLRKQEKLTGNRDKFAVFDSSSESDSDRKSCNSSASESDNKKDFISKMKLNKRKKFSRKRDKTILNFSPNEFVLDFPGNVNYNSFKESDSDVLATNTHKPLHRESSCKRKRTLNQYWKVLYDGSSSDSSELSTATTDSQETSSKNQPECTKNRITLKARKSYAGVCLVALYQTLKEFGSKTRSNYLDLGLVSNIFTIKIRLFLNEKSCRMYNPYFRQGFESR